MRSSRLAGNTGVEKLANLQLLQLPIWGRGHRRIRVSADIRHPVSVGDLVSLASMTLSSGVALRKPTVIHFVHFVSKKNAIKRPS